MALAIATSVSRAGPAIDCQIGVDQDRRTVGHQAGREGPDSRSQPDRTGDGGVGATAASDRYALSVVAFELLTGERAPTPSAKTIRVATIVRDGASGGTNAEPYICSARLNSMVVSSITR